jgi:hypothetical protein
LILVLFQFTSGFAGTGELYEINLRGNADPELVNTVWKWPQTLDSEDRRSFPPNPQHYTLTLMSDGKVNIRADGNRGGDVYALMGNEISGEEITTKRQGDTLKEGAE